MSKQTDSSFFMFPPLSKHARFYQELVRGIKNYHQLGNRLIELGEQAHAFRQFKQVKEIGLVLSNIPIKEYQTVGYYFLAVAANENGNGDQQHAKKLYEVVANNAIGKYEGKAILSLAAVACNTKDYESQLHYLVETLKASTDLSTLVKGRLGIAIYKSVEGFHRQSLKDLENLYPLARLSHPVVFFDYLNSLAVELGEAGRKYEARNVIQHVIASPFASVYPEWQETAQESKEPNRSFISVSRSAPKIERKHVKIEPEPLPEPEQEERPADILPFTRPKEAPPPPKPERIPQDILDHMSVSQKSQLVISLVQSKTLSSYGYNKMLASVGMVKRGASAKEIELDDLAFMADLISEWCNLIDPRLFIGVISALRDCDDRVRRTNIMDNMISEAIRQTDDSIESEEECRRKYERRLPKE
jgi:tetratricopeptide (TPR) repeat protein